MPRRLHVYTQHNLEAKTASHVIPRSLGIHVYAARCHQKPAVGSRSCLVCHSHQFIVPLRSQHHQSPRFKQRVIQVCRFCFSSVDVPPSLLRRQLSEARLRWGAVSTERTVASVGRRAIIHLPLPRTTLVSSAGTLTATSCHFGTSGSHQGTMLLHCCCIFPTPFFVSVAKRRSSRRGGITLVQFYLGGVGPTQPAAFQRVVLRWACANNRPHVLKRLQCIPMHRRDLSTEDTYCQMFALLRSKLDETDFADPSTGQDLHTLQREPGEDQSQF